MIDSHETRPHQLQEVNS